MELTDELALMGEKMQSRTTGDALLFAVVEEAGVADVDEDRGATLLEDATEGFRMGVLSLNGVKFFKPLRKIVVIPPSAVFIG